MRLEKEVNEILSLKKMNNISIDRFINDQEKSIKSNLDDIFTDVHAAKTCGKYLLRLAALKDARLAMGFPAYKAYEKSGKETDFETWLSENWAD